MASKQATNKTKFLEVYEKLKLQLLEDSETFTFTEDSRRWVEELLDYNVPGGKLNRGLSVIDSLDLLKGEQGLSENERFLAHALGWCIEWLQAYFLVLDDIMDNSVTRRGKPCWFRVEKVGLIAVNDGILLRNHIFRILKWHFRPQPYYIELNDLFNEVEFQTCNGQMLDVILTPAGNVDLSKYCMSTYMKIVQYKTAYYSFYLPVACALLMSGESLVNFQSAKEILVLMGTYFQIQDDFLDCYGDPNVIGKIGTDIEDAKCSWLIVQALQKANKDQRQCLHDSYGKADPSHVAAVKRVYNELDLQSTFLGYEQESHKQLIVAIEREENQAMQVVLKSFLAKIFKRSK